MKTTHLHLVRSLDKKIKILTILMIFLASIFLVYAWTCPDDGANCLVWGEIYECNAQNCASPCCSTAPCTDTDGDGTIDPDCTTCYDECTCSDDGSCPFDWATGDFRLASSADIKNHLDEIPSFDDCVADSACTEALEQAIEENSGLTAGTLSLSGVTGITIDGTTITNSITSPSVSLDLSEYTSLDGTITALTAGGFKITVNSGSVTITEGTFTSSSGGSFTLNSDGSFTLNSDVEWSGTDADGNSITIITDSDGSATYDPATDIVKDCVETTIIHTTTAGDKTNVHIGGDQADVYIGQDIPDGVDGVSINGPGVNNFGIQVKNTNDVQALVGNILIDAQTVTGGLSYAGKDASGSYVGSADFSELTGTSEIDVYNGNAKVVVSADSTGAITIDLCNEALGGCTPSDSSTVDGDWYSTYSSDYKAGDTPITFIGQSNKLENILHSDGSIYTDSSGTVNSNSFTTEGCTSNADCTAGGTCEYTTAVSGSIVTVTGTCTTSSTGSTSGNNEEGNGEGSSEGSSEENNEENNEEETPCSDDANCDCYSYDSDCNKIGLCPSGYLNEDCYGGCGTAGSCSECASDTDCSDDGCISTTYRNFYCDTTTYKCLYTDTSNYAGCCSSDTDCSSDKCEGTTYYDYYCDTSSNTCSYTTTSNYANCCTSSSDCSDDECINTTYRDHYCDTTTYKCLYTDTSNYAGCCSSDSDCSTDGCTGTTYRDYYCNSSYYCSYTGTANYIGCTSASCVFTIKDLYGEIITGNLERQEYIVNINLSDYRKINSVTNLEIKANNDVLPLNESNVTSDNDGYDYYGRLNLQELDPDTQYTISFKIEVIDEYDLTSSCDESRTIEKMTYLQYPEVVIE